MERKILAAIDGSGQAMDAIRYICRIFPSKNTQVVLFHVRSEVPESFLDLGKEHALSSKVASVSTWMIQMNNNIENFMADAKSILTEAGFSPELVKIKNQNRKIGVARDILKESTEGYDLIVVGRTGISEIKNLMVGSVANKLIGRVPHIPVVTVGGNPQSKKILIGFDGSEDSMKAVNVIAKLLGDADCEVTLLHVIRPMEIHYGLNRVFDPAEEAEWTAINKKLIENSFLKAERILKNAGFLSEQISTDILTKNTSRAAAIAHKAEDEGYGTVVVGRRGLTIVEEFIMGRVSTKVLNMVTKAAVWVV